MRVTSFEIEGPKLIAMPMYRDERGFFVERFRKDRFFDLGIGAQGAATSADAFVQDNFSRSHPGVVRGLHAQFAPGQGKLVTCVSGRIFDVAVDIRAKSPTFGRSVSAVLCGDEPSWLWIPPGFAHGFCVLGDTPADVSYKVTAHYNAAGECGILWNDPELGVKWPLDRPPVLSAKDLQLPSFASYRKSPHF
jgi:dTDP-4-dehydrorhamnose 3,5-epimerase